MYKKTVINTNSSEMNNQRRLRLAVETTGLGFWEWNLRENTVRWDSQMFSLYGMTPSENGFVNYEDWRSSVLAEDIAEQESSLQETIRRKAENTREFRIKRLSDGAERIIRAVDTVSLDADGNVEWVVGTNIDITDSKLMGQQLRDSEERLRRLFDSSPDPVWIIDNFHFVECNQAAVEILGYPDKESLQNTHPSELSPEYQPDGELSFSKAEQMMKIAQEKGINRFEWVHTRKDGSNFFAEVTLSALTLQGKPVIHCIWRDITERKEAEAAAMHWSRMLKESIESIDQGFSIYDEDDRLVMCNETYLDFYATSRDFIVPGATFRDIIKAGAERGQYKGAEGHVDEWVDKRVARHQQGDGRYYEQLLDDGRWLHITENRTPSGFIVGNRVDITERKQVEVELERHRNQLQELVEEQTSKVRQQARIIDQVHDSIVSTDLDGIINSWNNGAVRLFGRTAEEMLGKHISSVYPAEDHEFLMEKVIKPLKEKGDHEVEVRMLKGDGSPFYAHLSLSLLHDDDANPVGMVGYSVDTTERKAAEKAMQAAKQAAEAASLAKSSFLANMSHEIRTPLTAITGMTHLLRDSGLNEEQSLRLHNIDIASQHLLEVINAILDLSKIEAGKFNLVQNDLSIEHVADTVASIIIEPAKAKGLNVVVENPSFSFLVIGDQTRLQQALLNYAINAVKFTESGSIIFRTRVINETPDDVMIRFEVQDTGIGVEPGMIDRLFTAFEQADNSISRKYGGTGLGLAITKKIAQLHNGDAGMESTDDAGSVFWFTAKLRKSQQQPQRDVFEENLSEPAEIILARDYADHRILVVDDEPMNREIVIEFLGNIAGQLVDTVADGVEALEAFRQEPYDLVLMDMQMPNMDGLEATRRIRQLPLGKHVPIIAMTANAFAEDTKKCMESGMNDFISKPFDIDGFYRTVLKWLMH